MATINAIGNKTGTLSTTSNLYPTGVSFDSGTTTMSTYAYNTYTPTINFDGGTTGITYTTQNGYYWQIGRLLFVTIQIVLSDRGSSDGSLYVTLPVASATNAAYMNATIIPQTTGRRCYYLYADGSTANGQFLSCLFDTSDTVVITRANTVANTSEIRCSGVYYV